MLRLAGDLVSGRLYWEGEHARGSWRMEESLEGAAAYRQEFDLL